MIASMMLAGVPVSAELISELAQIVDEPTASMLERGLEVGTKVLALTIVDRERIIAPSMIRQPGSPSSGVCCSVSTSGACARESFSSKTACIWRPTQSSDRSVSTCGGCAKDLPGRGRTLGRSCRLPMTSFSYSSSRCWTCIESRMRSREKRQGSTRTYAPV